MKVVQEIFYVIAALMLGFVCFEGGKAVEKIKYVNEATIYIEENTNMITRGVVRESFEEVYENLDVTFIERVANHFSKGN